MSTSDPVADLLPARMLNEFVYCPRLFFYEHVEGVFVHNSDTLRGADQHTRVDSGSGAMPKARKRKTADAATPAAANTEPTPEEVSASDVSPPETDVPGDSSVPKPETQNSEPASASETIHSRSVMLGSDTLGVVAKLDLVEVTVESAPANPDSASPLSASQISDSKSQISKERAATVVRPVEYKSGPPRLAADGTLAIWDADRIQLGLQMLLLRENGYACDEGVIYYRQTRQRVRFTLDTDTEVWIHRNIAAARACTGHQIPSPLEHSPKCPRCSLVSICLPDETNLLRTGPDAELPPPESQLALPGLLAADAAALADSTTLADALALDEDPAWETLPEPRFPRPLVEGDVRRLIAPDIDTKALYVNTPGVSITKKGETVVVKEQGSPTLEVRIKDIHHLAIFGAAQLSTALVQTLCEHDVPISFFSMGGWFYGLARGHGLTNVFTRIRQFARAAEPEQSLPIARLFVYGKIRNQRTILMRNHVEPPPLALRALKHAASAALTANSHATLLGIEGAAALCYFRHFGGMIKTAEEQDDIPGLEDTPSPTIGAGSSSPTALAVGGPPAQTLFNFDFKTRNRRPPRDPVNALLSLAYSLLARDCTIAAHAVGFDPYVGFFHQPRFGRPALALDLMEEFRPLVADSVVLTAINNRMIGPGDFVQAGDAVNLNTAGRKRFLFVYEKRMGDTVTHPIFDYKVSYRRAIELQFRLLARTLTGEIDRYVPFTTR
jgi:CRISPR-associated protein Cas1